MEFYTVYTTKGSCECVERNGVYFPIREEDYDFIGETITTVERKEVHN